MPGQPQGHCLSQSGSACRDCRNVPTGLWQSPRNDTQSAWCRHGRLSSECNPAITIQQKPALARSSGAHNLDKRPESNSPSLGMRESRYRYCRMEQRLTRTSLRRPSDRCALWARPPALMSERHAVTIAMMLLNSPCHITDLSCHVVSQLVSHAAAALQVSCPRKPTDGVSMYTLLLPQQQSMRIPQRTRSCYAVQHWQAWIRWTLRRSGIGSCTPPSTCPCHVLLIHPHCSQTAMTDLSTPGRSTQCMEIQSASMVVEAWGQAHGARTASSRGMGSRV
jgi:hypothetical protein